MLYRQYLSFVKMIKSLPFGSSFSCILKRNEYKICLSCSFVQSTRIKDAFLKLLSAKHFHSCRRNFQHTSTTEVHLRTTMTSKWGLSASDLCKCGQPQTVTHIVDSCAESSLDGGLPRLHSAAEYESTWLNSVVKEALAKWMKWTGKTLFNVVDFLSVHIHRRRTWPCSCYFNNK